VKDVTGTSKSKFQSDPAETLNGLLDLMAKSLDSGFDKDTYIILSGTGGMRTLDVKESDRIYKAAREAAENSGYKNLVSFENLSGSDEAKLAWISANYVSGYRDDESSSKPIIEFGGNSVQVVFKLINTGI
jgi:Golgi nucleoside diphosphatase